MRNLNPYIAGGLIAIAVFIICNCAGYLIVTFIGSGMLPQNQPGSADQSSGPPTQAAVVVFVTPTSTTEPILSTPIPPTLSPNPPTPIPLLPTVTHVPPTAIPTHTPVLPATTTPLPPNTATPTTIRVVDATATQSIASDQLQILSHQSYVDSLGWYHIVGEVQNNSDVPMEFVEVVAKLYDEANNVIGTKLTFTAPDVIFPGGKAPFDVITLRRTQWQKIKEYKLQVKGDVSQSLLQQNLILLNQSSRIQDQFLYVAGEVQNTGNTPALVKLIITLYDADFNVINTNWGYADTGIIPPNNTSAFEVKITHQTDPDNYHYRIQIEEESIDTD